MSDPLWLVPDISKTVVPPLTNTPDARSAAALCAIIDQFEVDTAERYRVRDVDNDGKKETFCNIFVSDVTRALFAEIPHQWEGHWQDVHAMADWVRRGFGSWRTCSLSEAQAMADVGRPAVAILDPAIRAHGHIALFRPSLGAPGLWIAQAGGRNFKRGPITLGFGALVQNCQFFTHP